MTTETTLTVLDLRAWLLEHADAIAGFMDYEATLEDDDAFAQSLGDWFGEEDWNPSGYGFVHLGHDGAGSVVAAWLHDGEEAHEAPVILFGSEGGYGVLTPSPWAWAQAITHAPALDEHDSDAPLSPDANWMLDPDDNDPEDLADAQADLASYQAAAAARFGQAPDFEALIDVSEALREELAEWIEGVLGTW